MDFTWTGRRRQLTARLAMAILTLLPAAAQDSAPAVKKSALTVVVKTSDSKDLPANAKVQITFHDKTCGDLFGGPDRNETIVNGKARFEDLAVCRISIKVDVPGYLNPARILKPADFKPEIDITLTAESR
jgi:hypothetical protein